MDQILLSKSILLLLLLLFFVHKYICIQFAVEKFKDIHFILVFFPYFLSSFADNVNCEKPHLRISPSQAPLRLPVGKSQVITCQGKVENSDLISDLRWTNAEGIQIQPKT